MKLRYWVQDALLALFAFSFPIVKMKKSQITMELFAIAGIILILFIVVFLAIKDGEMAFNRYQDGFEMQNECNRILDYITSTFISGEGLNATIQTKYYLQLKGKILVVGTDSSNPATEGVSCFHNVKTEDFVNKPGSSDIVLPGDICILFNELTNRVKLYDETYTDEINSCI